MYEQLKFFCRNSNTMNVNHHCMIKFRYSKVQKLNRLQRQFTVTLNV
jgi:hypothetical protein